MAGLNFTSLRRWRFGNSQAQDGRLLEQFFVTLDGSLKQLVRSGGAAARHDDIVAEVTKLLAEAPSWRTAYHNEQLLVPLYGRGALEGELRGRRAEAGARGAAPVVNTSSHRSRSWPCHGSLAKAPAMLARRSRTLRPIWSAVARRRRRRLGAKGQPSRSARARAITALWSTPRCRTRRGWLGRASTSGSPAAA